MAFCSRVICMSGGMIGPLDSLGELLDRNTRRDEPTACAVEADQCLLELSAIGAQRPRDAVVLASHVGERALVLVDRREKLSVTVSLFCKHSLAHEKSQ